MKCQSLCDEKATLYVHAWGERSWSGYHCDKHAGRLIKLRAKLIRRYKQNVTIRSISKMDRDKMRAAIKKGKKK